MIWDQIKRLWVNNKTNSSSLVKAPIIIEDEFPRVKMLSMLEVSEILDTGESLNISLIREGCKICNIAYIGGGVLFVNKQPSIEEEHILVKRQLVSQFYKTRDYLVAYTKINKNHPDLSYYNVIAIESTSMLDLKKAFKIQKLKAFL